MLPIIQSLWIGNPLSNLEKLCIQSFLDNGHGFHLYTYTDIGGVPAGTIIKDANEILSQKNIFKCRRGSYALYADWFRWALLYKHGGWWVDMDIVCLKPFDFSEDVVLSSHSYTLPGGISLLLNNVMRFPLNHPLCLHLLGCCANPNRVNSYDSLRVRVRKIKRTLQHKGRESTPWGESGGPIALTNAAQYYKHAQHAKPSEIFHPECSVSNWKTMLLEHADFEATTLFPHSYSLHMENEHLRRKGFDKNATYSTTSLVERLKRKHKIQPSIVRSRL